MNYLHFVGIAQVTFEEGFPILILLLEEGL